MPHSDASAPAPAKRGLFSLVRDEERATVPERVTLRLSPEMKRAVEEILDATPSETPTDAIRRAIVIYHTLLMQKLEGNEPFIERKTEDGSERIPVFF